MVIQKGLEGITVTTSAICTIDGQAGILSYRGYDIHDLAEQCSFEEVVYLLWFGELPTENQLASFKERLGSCTDLSHATEKLLSTIPNEANPMDALRTAISSMALVDQKGAQTPPTDPETNLQTAINLVAKTGSAVTAFHRIRNGQEPVAHDPSQGIAFNFLYQLKGEKPTELEVKVFDTCLVLHAEHEFNASTFSARVTASTLSDVYSAVTSAIGTLKGPLHGGANERVLKTLNEIGSADRVDEYLQKAFERKDRIMGFGHRIYKTEDPRATHLRKMAQKLSEQAGDLALFEIQKKLEKLMLEKKGLNANVDFYSASVYHYLGIPSDLFTPIFACSRVSGWTAHVMEQYSDNRLIRPLSEYTGPAPRSYVPLSERSI